MKNGFKGKKVLVLGLGVNQGGVGAAKFFAEHEAIVRVTDLKTASELKISLDQLKEFSNIGYTLEEHKYEDIDWADLVIKNPAIRPNNPYFEYAIKQGKEIEMDMGIFLKYVSPQQIIGITGTKGKSTTSSLIYEVLKASGKKVVFAGNIGKSVLDTIPYVKKDTLVVLELSSFQLEAFDAHKISPHISVITNIFPDHLNYYGTMDKYITAKRVIAKYQTKQDFVFLYKYDGNTSKKEFLKGLKGKVIFFDKADLPKSFSPLLPGDHNLVDISAAIAVAKTLEVSKDLALKIASEFKGVEFRMQLIKEWHGTKIYNDTAATNPDASIQALKALPHCILIAGGVNKNLFYEEFAKEIPRYAKSVFFLAGDATDEILKNLPKGNKKIKGIYSNIEKLVKDVKKTVQKGDVVLFSPGAASFNLFQNEFDRGRKFNTAVEKTFK